MDWHEFMTVMGFGLAIGLAWEVMRLRPLLHLDDITPTRKWKRAIEGEKYLPIAAPDSLPTEADGNHKQFFG